MIQFPTPYGEFQPFPVTGGLWDCWNISPLIPTSWQQGFINSMNDSKMGGLSMFLTVFYPRYTVFFPNWWWSYPSPSCFLMAELAAAVTLLRIGQGSAVWKGPWKEYPGKPPYLVGKTMVSGRISLKPSHWFQKEIPLACSNLVYIWSLILSIKTWQVGSYRLTCNEPVIALHKSVQEDLRETTLTHIIEF